MFGIGLATRIYLALGATDMRKGFEGLYGLQVKDLVNLARITVGRNFAAHEWRLYSPDEKHRKTSVKTRFYSP